MVKLFAILTILPVAALAADFSLTIGPPVAVGADTKVFKKVAALFAVRLEQCADLSKAQVTASTMIAGNAPSGSVVMIQPTGKPGIYLASQNLDGRGNAVVTITATCGGQEAGAIVPVAPAGYLRDSVQTFSRAPTRADAQAALAKLQGR